MDDDTQDRVAHRLRELEIKASYTEDLLDQLNLLVYKQQQQIDSLLRQVLQLREQAPDGGAGTPRSLRDELPPHY
jgi:SlyX protein